MLKMVKNDKKKLAKNAKNGKNRKKNCQKILKFLRHFTRGGSPPPENILFLTPKKNIKVYLWC